MLDELRAEPKESDWFEFKVNNHSPDEMGKRICGLSNAAALVNKPFAYIVWGVQDSDHQVVGTTFVPSKERHKGQPLEFWLAKIMSPSIPLRFINLPHPQGPLVLLEIPAASSVPIKFNNIAWIRIGSATSRLAEYQDREAALLDKLRPFVWERGHALQFVTGDDVFDLLDVDAYFQFGHQAKPESRQDILQRLEAERVVERDVGSKWTITNLGAVLFAREIENFERISRKRIRLIKYGGTTRVGKGEEIAGARGYVRSFDGITRHLKQTLPFSEEVGRAFRKEVPVFPEIAIRELIANALVHQDFAITGAGPLVEVFSDRIEITNPGASLVAADRVIDFPPRSRNESLAALMRKLKICEERGVGFDRVVASAEVFQLPPPDFRTDGDNTKAVLHAPRAFKNMDQEERVRACYQHAVLRYLSSEKMTNTTLRTRFGIEEQNASQVSRVIGDALDAKVIKKSNSWNPRTGHYLPFWA